MSAAVRLVGGILRRAKAPSPLKWASAVLLPCIVMLVTHDSAGGQPQPMETAECSPGNPGTASGRRVAVTFDDLPAVSVAGAGGCDRAALIDLTSRILAGLDQHDITAVGMVTAGSLCPSLRTELLPELLTMWFDAGMEIGNHTFSHPDLNSTPLEQYKQDVLRGEHAIRAALGVRDLPIRYFRHPLLHTGADKETKQAVTRFLDERGYQVAPVTIDSDEWMFARVYSQALGRGDSLTAGRVGASYLTYMTRSLDFYEIWSEEVLGYELPQVLLLHANELNADWIGRLAEMLKNRGYAFVSLESALEDPAYRLLDDYVGPRGLSWLHRWALSKRMQLRNEPAAPDWIVELYQGG